MQVTAAIKEKLNMKRSMLTSAIIVCALGTTVYADVSGFLDFEDPDAEIGNRGIVRTENPYHGTTWSNASDGLSHLGVMDVDWYNKHYGEFGADLSARSGDQVGFNGFGDNNVSVSFEGDMFIDFYLTPWVGQGAYNVQVDFYDDDVLVHSVPDVPMIDNVWTHIDSGGIAADMVVFRKFSEKAEWWLIENLTFTKVPAPGALAVLGLAALGRHRRSS
jgi:hypothetical protein